MGRSHWGFTSATSAGVENRRPPLMGLLKRPAAIAEDLHRKHSTDFPGMSCHFKNDALRDKKERRYPKAQRIRVSGQIAEPQVGIAVTSARGMDLIRFLGMTADLSRFLAPTPLSDTDPANADFQRESAGIQSSRKSRFENTTLVRAAMPRSDPSRQYRNEG